MDVINEMPFMARVSKNIANIKKKSFSPAFGKAMRSAQCKVSSIAR